MLLFFILMLPLVQQRSAFAHDIWLHAERYRLEKGDTLIVSQLLGAELETDLLRPETTQELPVLRDMTPRFALITAQGSVNLLAELPDMRTQPVVQPVLERKVDFDGLALVTMEHAIIYTEFTSKEFLEYLDHEEFDREKFEEHMGSTPFQTEGYQRTLKCLVRVGEATGRATATEVYKQVLGQTIEILLLQNPYRLDPGDDLEVRVLFDGEPLPGRLVNAYNSDGSGSVFKHRARTNADGIARFNLERAGRWLLRLVHLVPCSGRSEVDCEDAAWESYWTAYSFELD